MPNHFFHFKQFSILSQEKGLRVNTDACLLGAVAGAGYSPSSVLDIGTGTGVISLMLAQRFPKTEITALEIDEEVFHQAETNVRNSPFKERIQVLHADFLKTDFPESFRLVVCNPPYFNRHLQKPDKGAKNNAIHNNQLPFSELMAKIGKCLDKEGKAELICPAAEAQMLIREAGLNELFLERKLTIINQRKVFRNILCFGKQNRAATEEELIIKEEGRDTEAFRALMNDFYLDNTDIYKRKRSES